MVPFILKRLAAGAVLLVAISILTYTLLYFSSANIARNILGDQATEEAIALKEAELGLDQPFLVRFFDWAGSAITGDLGRSWFSAETVASALTNRLPITLTLVVIAILLTAIGSGRGGIPFFSTDPPAIPLLIWSVGYVSAILIAAIASFGRRDL